MSESREIDRVGLALGAGAYGLWGLFPLYFHRLSQASALEILAHRIVWSFLILSLVAVVRRQRHGRPFVTLRSTSARWSMLGGVLLSINWLIYVWAVNADRVIDASLGYFINPIFTVLLGVLVLRETIRPLQKLAIGFGAAASLSLAIAYGEIPWIALSLAGSFGLYGLIKKHAGLEMFESLTIETSVVFPFAMIGLIASTVAGHSAFLHISTALDLKLVGLGIVTVVPLVLFGAAASRISLVWTGLLQYLTPWMQFLLGWLYFHETMPPQRLVGFALIWVALGVLAIDAIRQVSARHELEPPV